MSFLITQLQRRQNATNFLKLIILLSGVIISGCTRQPSLERTITPSNIASQTSGNPTAVATTIIPSATIVTVMQPTMIVTIEKTSTPGFASYPTPDPDSNVTFQRLKVLQEIPSEDKKQGTFVLINPYLSAHFQIVLQDIDTGAQQFLLKEGFASSHYSVSPDGKWLAYDEAKGEPGVDVITDVDKIPPFWMDRSLVVVSSTGQEKSRIPYEAGWGALSRWVTNDTLIIRNTDQGFYSTYTAKLVLNPFKHSNSDLSADPKDLYKLSVYDWDGIGMVSYNPSLAYRVYPSDQGLILENVSTHTVVAQILTTLDSPCEWSTNGKEFIFVGPTEYDMIPARNELIRVNLLGEQDQLTNLSRSDIEIYPFSYTWSPDGNKVAFWVSSSSSRGINDVNPAVFDLPSGKVTVFNTIESRHNKPPKPVWSPDSKQLLLGLNSKTETRSVLIDLSNYWVVELAKIIPVGWLSQ